MTCPNCRQSVEDGKPLCPHCGAVTASNAGGVWPPPVPAVCPRCGRGVPAGAAACPVCGLRFGSTRRKSANGWLIAGTTCGVAALSVAAIVVVAGILFLVVAWEAIKSCFQHP